MVRLSDLSSSIFRGVAPKYTDDNGIVVLNQKCVRNWTIDMSQSRLTHASKISTNKYLINGDILINSTGIGTVGRVAQYCKDCEKITVDSHITIVRPDSHIVHPAYLGYSLKAKEKEIGLLAKGSTGQVELSRQELGDLEINLPDLPTQKKIAGILSSLDDKIELNRQMNETLEQMGQALFRHYFIDNPESKNWSKRQLREFFPIVTGKKDANFATSDGKYPFFTCGKNILAAPSYSFDADAILLSGNGDFNVKYYSGKFEAYQRTYVLIPHDNRMLGFLYFLIKINLPEITGGSRGSVIKFITKGMIEKYSMLLPNDEVIVNYTGYLNNIIQQITFNNVASDSLVAIRNELIRRMV